MWVIKYGKGKINIWYLISEELEVDVTPTNCFLLKIKPLIIIRLLIDTFDFFKSSKGPILCEEILKLSEDTIKSEWIKRTF